MQAAVTAGRIRGDCRGTAPAHTNLPTPSLRVSQRPAAPCLSSPTHPRPAGNGGSARAVQGRQERALAHHRQARLLVVQSSQGSSCTGRGAAEQGDVRPGAGGCLREMARGSACTAASGPARSMPHQPGAQRGSLHWTRGPVSGQGHQPLSMSSPERSSPSRQAMPMAPWATAGSISSADRGRGGKGRGEGRGRSVACFEDVM